MVERAPRVLSPGFEVRRTLDVYESPAWYMVIGYGWWQYVTSRSQCEDLQYATYVGMLNLGIYILR